MMKGVFILGQTISLSTNTHDFYSIIYPAGFSSTNYNIMSLITLQRLDVFVIVLSTYDNSSAH